MSVINKISGKWSNLTVGAKATIVYFSASLVNKAIAYITTPLFTHMLTSEEFGQVTHFSTWQSLIGIVAMFCLQAGVFNNGMIEYEDDRDGFTLSMLALSNLITVIVASVLLISPGTTQRLLKVDQPLIYLMIIGFVFQPAYSFWYTRQRYEYRYKSAATMVVVMHVAGPLAAILCIAGNVTGNHVYDRLFGTELTLLLFYIVFYIRIIIKGKAKIQTKYWKFAFFFNLPLIPHYLSQYLMNGCDKIMITSLINESATAYYGVAYTVAAVVSVFWTSLNSSLVPFTYERCKRKDYRAIEKTIEPLWYCFAIVCFLLMVFAPEVMSMLAPEEYKAGMYVIPPVIGGVFFQALYYSFANINYYYKKTKYVMYASLIAAIVNIILNYLLIPIYGFVIAGYTTLVSYMIQAAIDYYAMQKVIKEMDEGENCFHLKNIITISSIVVGVACVFPLCYSNDIIRFSVLGIMAVFLVLFRKKVKVLVNMMISLLKRK